MNKIPFCHLHVHDGYSLLDSMIRIKSAVHKVKEDGHTALAQTNHGNLAGIVKFVDECTKQKIKPILGMEAYIAIDSRHRKKYAKGEHSASHLILLAKNTKGWDNLRTLSTLAYTEGFYKKPRIDHELLQRHAEGLIVSSACMGSDICVHLMAGMNADGDGKVEFSPDIAEAKLLWYQGLFGPDFYAELQDHGQDSTQVKINEWLRSRMPESQIIATADCHYLEASDYDTHDSLLCCNTASSKLDPNRWRFPSDQCWLKTTEEMSQLFYEHELTNTQKIADQVEFELPLRKQWFMPELPSEVVPRGFSKEQINGIFIEHCWNGFYNRFPQYQNESIIDVENSQHGSRLLYEMDVIQRAGFVEYMLVLWDLMKWCREQDIMVGPGRGSAVGSLATYCLGITGVDPIERKLPFERFINPGRLERFAPPDIDLDFQKSRRQDVIEYLKQRYGEDHVCNIGTYSTFGPAKIVKKLGHVLNIPLDVVNKIANIIPEGESSLQGAGPAAEPHGLSLDNVWEQSDEFRKIIESLGETGLYLLHYARGLRSLGTHASTHASGIIITNKPVSDIIPLMVAKSGTKEEITLAQLDMSDVEAFGLIKFDILGLITLDILKEVEVNIKTYNDPNFTWEGVNLDDEKIYELLTSGRTMGIFQAAGGGYVRLLQQAKPKSVEDLAVLNSLCRPGPMLSGDTATYIRRRNGQEPIAYLFPQLKPILDSSNGCCAFQEQIMAIAHECAGFTLAEADDLRKVMGKKQVDKIPQYKQKLIDGLIQHCGITQQIGEKFWEQILPMAEYVFNRSHSMGYSYLTALTAWAKNYYPAYFLAAAMSAEIQGSGENLAILVRDAQMLNCTIIGPDVNNSQEGFTAIDPYTILTGLNCIRKCGENSVKKILEERRKNGPFESSTDWRARIAPRDATIAVLTNLQRSGAFDTIDENNYFAALTLDEQYEIFGFHLTGHPCLLNRHEWQKRIPNLVTLQEIIDDWTMEKTTEYTKFGAKRKSNYKQHTTCVMITKVTKKKSKKDGKFMFMMEIEDESATMKMIINANKMAQFGNPELKEGRIMQVIGRKSEDERWADYFNAQQIKML